MSYNFSVQGQSVFLKSGADVVHEFDIPKKCHDIDIFVDRDGGSLMVSTYTLDVFGLDRIYGVHKTTRIYSLTNFELKFKFDSLQYINKTI